jgi:hypothetical protein
MRSAPGYPEARSRRWDNDSRRGEAQASLEDYRTGLTVAAREHGERGARIGDPDAFDAAVAAIREASFRYDEFTSDEVIAFRGNELGAAFSYLRRQREITCVGFRVSKRPARHGGITRVWVRAT